MVLYIHRVGKNNSLSLSKRMESTSKKKYMESSELNYY